MRLLMTAALLALATAASAQSVTLGVRFDGDRTDALVQRALDWKALGLNPANVQVAEGGKLLPSQPLPDAILFRLPGLTPAGALRQVVVRAGAPAPAEADGIRVTEADGVITVENAFYAVEHAPGKNGGLPCRFTFKNTGRSEDSFANNDRLYDHGALRGYSVRDDKAPVVRVLSRGPLAAVVEVKARYLAADGTAPDSAPHATYRFRYAAGSPLVRVELRAEQEKPFSWSEFHFIELNTRSLSFPRWVLGGPDAAGTFADTQKSVRGRWGALVNDREAIGLQAGGVTIYDGYKGYGNYLHGDWTSWGDLQLDTAGWLYLGPADEGLAAMRQALAQAAGRTTVALVSPEVETKLAALGQRAAKAAGPAGVLARWHLEKARAGLLTASDLEPAGKEMAQVENYLKPKPGAQSVVVEKSADRLCAANDALALAFERAEGTIRLGSLYDGAGGRDFARTIQGAGGLWELAFRPPDFAAAKEVVVQPGTAPAEWAAQPGAAGTDIRLTWRGLDVGEDKGAADVTVTVHVPRKGSQTEWRIKVENRSEKLGLWSVTFPRIANLTVSPAGGLAAPQGWGQLYQDPTRTGGYTGDYPNGWATMQFASLFDGGHALYLAAHDGAAIHKRLVFTPQPEKDALAFSVVQFPEAMAAPGRPYESPYPVVLATHAGDWYDSARLYRAWAMEHSTWFPRVPLVKNKDVPEWLKQNPVWCQTGGDPKNVVAGVLQFREFFGVPIGFHWYSWHQIPFDDHYPEYFPPKEGFKEAVAQLKAAGVHVMPYINGRLFDSRTDSWRNDDAQAFCDLSEKGEKYVEVYGSKVPLSPMCPTTPYWQGKISGIVERLVGEYGVSGVYIDQIGAAGVVPCFNPKHPHGAGDAAGWVPGYRELLTKTRAKMRAKDPQSFLTTEDAAEPYQGKIDAFLMCNQTRGGLIPMYPAVYGGRTLTFGRYLFDSDLKASAPFVTKMGQMFVFGAQLGWLGPFVLNYPKEAGYMKRLVQTRVVATRYLALGEMLRPPVLETDAPPVKCNWDLWGTTFPIEFPAVIGSAWRAPDGSKALVVTNMTEQPVKLRWRAEGRSGTTDVEALGAKVIPVR